MDHSHHHMGMDHGGMDHGGMGHGGMDMGGDQCSMNMLFTWDTNNVCLVFRSWRIHNTFTLIVALLGTVALGAGYELIREMTRQYEMSVAKRLESIPNHVLSDEPESSSLLRPGNSRAAAERSAKVSKAFLYAVQVFYSFFIMLLFMTYNGWIMIAVAVGAFIGYLMFTPSSATAQKTVACH